jgi:hypothetical protein
MLLFFRLVRTVGLSVLESYHQEARVANVCYLDFVFVEDGNHCCGTSDGVNLGESLFKDVNGVQDHLVSLLFNVQNRLGVGKHLVNIVLVYFLLNFLLFDLLFYGEHGFCLRGVFAFAGRQRTYLTCTVDVQLICEVAPVGFELGYNCLIVLRTIEAFFLVLLSILVFLLYI